MQCDILYFLKIIEKWNIILSNYLFIIGINYYVWSQFRLEISIFGEISPNENLAIIYYIFFYINNGSEISSRYYVFSLRFHISKYIYRSGQLLNQQLPTVKRTEQSYSQCFFSASESQSSHVRFLISTPLTFLSAILSNVPLTIRLSWSNVKTAKANRKSIDWM